MVQKYFTQISEAPLSNDDMERLIHRLQEHLDERLSGEEDEETPDDEIEEDEEYDPLLDDSDESDALRESRELLSIEMQDTHTPENME